MNEFKVNDFLTLKLERGKTNFYVKDELFNRCKFLFTTTMLKKKSTNSGLMIGIKFKIIFL